MTAIFVPDNSCFNKYVRIVDISVNSDGSFQPSESIDVRVDHKYKSVQFVGDRSSQTFQWAFIKNIDVWPKFVLNVQLYQHPTLTTVAHKKLDLIEITGEQLRQARPGLTGERWDYRRQCNGFEIVIGLLPQNMRYQVPDEYSEDSGGQDLSGPVSGRA